MRLFYVTEPVEAQIAYDRRSKRFRASLDGPSPADGALVAAVHLSPPAGAAPTAEELYFATALEWSPLAQALAAAGRGGALRLLSEAASARVLATPGLPPRVGWVHGLGEEFETLEARLDRVAAGPRVAVVNFFHHAFGDAVVSLTALRELRLRWEERFGEAHIDLFQNDYVAGVEPLYRGSGLFGEVRSLPSPLSALAGYDAYFDFSLAAYDLEKPWTDALLELVGVDPATVPPARKRNRLARDADAAREVRAALAAGRAAGEPLLLFHPQASTALRSCPPARAERFVREVLETTSWTVACATPIAIKHPRFVDWSGASRTFAHFMALVAECDAFVSADTSVFHVADAFDIPGVVVLTTLRPEQRVAAYPYIEGISLRPGNALTGLHDSDDPRHAALATELWEELETGEVLAALKRATRRREEARTPPRGRRTAGARATGAP